MIFASEKTRKRDKIGHRFQDLVLQICDLWCSMQREKMEVLYL